jgi:hypothetical protein
MKDFKERRKYWKDRRDNYIEKVRGEYKVKEARGMTEERKTKCPFCFNEHIIDKYDWIDSCKGYMHLTEFEAIFLEGEKNEKK